MASFDLGKIKTRLLIGSAFMVGVTSLLSVAHPSTLITSIFIKILDSSLGVISGIVFSDLGTVINRLGTNELDSLADNLSKKEGILINQDTTRAIGRAMGAVILSVAKSETSPNDQKALRKLAEIAAYHWLESAELNTLTKTNAEISRQIEEVKQSATFFTHAQNTATLTVLTPEAWIELLNQLLKEKTKLPPLSQLVVKRVADELYISFPKALQEVLKNDFQTGGKAFAEMLLSLLGDIKTEITVRQDEILKRLDVLEIAQGGEALKQVLERLENFTQLKAGTPLAEAAFKELAGHMTTLLDDMRDVKVNTEGIVIAVEELSEIIHHLDEETHRKEPQPPVSLGQRLLRVVLPMSGTITILLVCLRFLGILQPLELKTFDWLMRLRPDEGQDERLLVIAITDEDMETENFREGGWSISDIKLNQLIAKLEKYQPRAIGLDLYRKKTNLKELNTQLRQNNNIFGVCKVSDPQINKRATPPPPEIPKQRQGFSDLLPDHDKIVRRHLLEMEPSDPDPKCSANYALNLQLARQYLQAKVTPTPKGLKISNVIFKPIQPFTGGYQDVDARGYQVLLNYRTHEGDPLKFVPQVTLGQVLNSDILDSIKNLSGRIVLVGVTATEPGDYWSVPYDEEIPGVVLQAQMVSQIISAVKDKRPLLRVWAQWEEWLWIGAWSLFGGILVLGFYRVSSLAIAEGIAFLGLGIICYVCLLNGLWLPLVPPALALVTVGLSVLIFTKSQFVRE